MKKTMEWFAVEMTGRAKKLPQWMRSVARDQEGTIFAPAVMGAPEMEVLLCAGHDGTPCVLDSEHLYVPLEWLAKEFPVASEACNSIKRRLQNYPAEFPS